MNLEELKAKLRTYTKKDLIFKQPHFYDQLIIREGSKEEVIINILNPENLVYAHQKEGNNVICLYFKISNTRTMMLPVVFNEKSLYIKTYIMRYRAWESMVNRREK